MQKKQVSLFLKGMLMGAADIVPGVSGGTMALITGIYEELIKSIDELNPSLLVVLQKKGVNAFWKAANGRFLAPLFLGIISSILFLSNGISYLLDNHPILIWSFFFGLILASISILFQQLKAKTWSNYLLLFLGFVIAFGITQLNPAGNSSQLWYLLICSMVAIIAMILPGISGAFIFILLGVYEEVLATVKGAINVWFDFNWATFQSTYSKVIAIGLGIILGLKLFSRLLTWLFTHKKEATLSLLVGFMMGALPKIWPWKNEITQVGEPIYQNTSPFTFEGNPQLILALVLMTLGSGLLLFMERYSQKK